MLAIKELLSNQSIPSENSNWGYKDSSISNPSLVEKVKGTMIAIGNSNQTFITKNINFNKFDERIGFELEIYKPMTLITLAIWNTDGEIIPVDKQAPSKKTAKKTDYAEGNKDFKVAIRIVSPYFMRRLVSLRFKYLLILL